MMKEDQVLPGHTRYKQTVLLLQDTPMITETLLNVYYERKHYQHLHYLEISGQFHIAIWFVHVDDKLSHNTGSLELYWWSHIQLITTFYSFELFPVNI